MLRVRLFGTGEAYFQDRSIPGFPNQRACLLLSYLLLNHNYPHNRERLAAIFWGDYATKISRKYLRNALWRLRQILQSVEFPTDDFLLISDDSVSFTNAQNCWIDVDEYDDITSSLMEISGRELTWDQAQQLESATELYTGDLLETIYEDWCLYDRERLRIAYFNALEKLVNFHGNRGIHRRGLDFCDLILSKDNTRERIHRQKMWLLWQIGDRNGALAQYKICCQILKTELGVKPMRETRQIYHWVQKFREAPSHWYGDIPAATPEYRPEETVPQTVQSLTESALDKLHHLQLLMAETNDEIQRIERLISKVLYSSKHS